MYNTDDGFFNALMDSAHKVFSPATYQCTLCRFTYGLTGMLLPWKNFVESLSRPTIFLHRREFRREFPDVTIELPAILIQDTARPELLLSAADIKAAGSLEGLIAATRARLAALDSTVSG